MPVWFCKSTAVYMKETVLLLFVVVQKLLFGIV